MERNNILMLFLFISLSMSVGIMKTFWSTSNCEGDWSFRTYIHEDRCMCFQDDYVSRFDLGQGTGCSRMQLEHHQGRQREMKETFRTFWDCDHDNPYSYEENENYERFGFCEDRGTTFHHGSLEYRSFKANRVPWFSWFAAYTPIGENDLADLYYSMEDCKGNHVFAIAVKNHYSEAVDFPNALRYKPGDCPGMVCLESLPNREGRGSVVRGCGVQPWASYDYTLVVVIIGFSLFGFCIICMCYLFCTAVLGFMVCLRMTRFDENPKDYEEVIVLDDSNEIQIKKKKKKNKKNNKKKKFKQMLMNISSGDDDDDDDDDNSYELDDVYGGTSGGYIYDYNNVSSDNLNSDSSNLVSSSNEQNTD